MTQLTEMVNIGKELAKKLQSIDIDCAEKLVEMGAKEAYLRLRDLYPNICLVHLYALEGAITDTEFNNLPDETKKELKAFCNKINSEDCR